MVLYLPIESARKTGQKRVLVPREGSYRAVSTLTNYPTAYPGPVWQTLQAVYMPRATRTDTISTNRNIVKFFQVPHLAA